MLLRAVRPAGICRLVSTSCPQLVDEAGGPAAAGPPRRRRCRPPRGYPHSQFCRRSARRGCGAGQLCDSGIEAIRERSAVGGPRPVARGPQQREWPTARSPRPATTRMASSPRPAASGNRCEPRQQLTPSPNQGTVTGWDRLGARNAARVWWPPAPSTAHGAAAGMVRPCHCRSSSGSIRPPSRTSRTVPRCHCGYPIRCRPAGNCPAWRRSVTAGAGYEQRWPPARDRHRSVAKGSG